MIANAAEYQKAREELRSLEDRLAGLQQTGSIGSKGFTNAGVRKMIARLHEELAVFEASEESRQPEAKKAAEPGSGPCRRIVLHFAPMSGTVPRRYAGAWLPHVMIPGRWRT
jgi:hypothetical protein